MTYPQNMTSLILLPPQYRNELGSSKTIILVFTSVATTTLYFQPKFNFNKDMRLRFCFVENNIFTEEATSYAILQCQSQIILLRSVAAGIKESM